MSSEEEDRPPRKLLTPLTGNQSTTISINNSSTMNDQRTTISKPYRITFSSREAEVRYIDKLMENCEVYDGNPETLLHWLKQTGSFLLTERVPETDHPFIIRHLLQNEALDFYQAHEDIIFNFYDLRKLFLHRVNALSSLRIDSTVDFVPLAGLKSVPSILTSTRLPETSELKPTSLGLTSTYFGQSLEEITQNDIRKTILEELQRNHTKFTGEHRQDVIKWLTGLETKFDTAGIPPTKRFDLIAQLLEKGALEWFLENKEKFNRSWDEFVTQFKQTFEISNRSYTALQKLQSYAQAPHQDVRSFCREMRKLFREADEQMSSNMQLNFLLAKIKPSYRLHIIQKGPSNFEEFEQVALSLERNYLLLETLEQLPSSTVAENKVTFHPQNQPSQMMQSSNTATPSYIGNRTESGFRKDFNRVPFRRGTYSNTWRPPPRMAFSVNRPSTPSRSGYTRNQLYSYPPTVYTSMPNQELGAKPTTSPSEHPVVEAEANATQYASHFQ